MSVRQPSASFAAETCPVWWVLPNRAFQYCVTVPEALLSTHMHHCRRKYETKHTKPMFRKGEQKAGAVLSTLGLREGLLSLAWLSLTRGSPGTWMPAARSQPSGARL